MYLFSLINVLFFNLYILYQLFFNNLLTIYLFRKKVYNEIALVIKYLFSTQKKSIFYFFFSIMKSESRGRACIIFYLYNNYLKNNDRSAKLSLRVIKVSKIIKGRLLYQTIQIITVINIFIFKQKNSTQKRIKL